ncbi:MAG: hypothetical protein AAGU74_09905 [Bacillota bacterium]
MTKRVGIVLSLAFCCLLVLLSKEAMQAARDGISLWWQMVVPALFPFFVGTTMLQRAGALTAVSRIRASKLFKIPPAGLSVMLISAMSGAPTGARMCALMLEDRAMSRDQAERFAALCNFSSPMFIIGSLGSGMLKDARAALPILVGHLLSSLVMIAALSIFRPLPGPSARMKRRETKEFSPWRDLTDAISDGALAMLRIGGAIVLFIVIIALIDTTVLAKVFALPIFDTLERAIGFDPKLARAMFIGSIEMTNGCRQIAALSAPLQWRAALCSATVSAGGLCVLMQSLAFIDLNPFKYLTLKQVQSVLSGAITFVLFPLLAPEAASAMAQWDPALFEYNALTGLMLLIASTLGLSVVALLLAVGRRALLRHKT